MDELIDKAIEMDYLHEGGKVTLTLDGDSQWISDNEREIKSTLNETFNSAWSVTIEVETQENEILEEDDDLDYDEDDDDEDDD